MAGFRTSASWMLGRSCTGNDSIKIQSRLPYLKRVFKRLAPEVSARVRRLLALRCVAFASSPGASMPDETDRLQMIH